MQGGIFDLNTPQDLFEKLKHDYLRVTAAPGDRYAAMDFIITANHLRDWVSSHDKREIKMRPLLEVCRALANNSKHFVVRDTQVADGKVRGGTFQFGAFDPAAFDVGHLFIEIGGNGSDLGSEMRIGVFARKVVEFWQVELGLD